MVDLCANCDVVFLGEYKDMPAIRTEIEGKNRVWYDLHYEPGRLHFNNGLFYNPESFQFDVQPAVFNSIPGYTGGYRVGQKVTAQSVFAKTNIDFYVVHWSSYIETDNEEIKSSAATVLASEIMDSSTDFQICLGDFNVEPYSKPLAALGSSRSVEYVYQHGGFYNPFWQHLYYTGTLKYTNHRGLKCFAPMFDQILLDQKWLTTGRYEFESDILGLPYELKKGEHSPIVLTIREKTNIYEEE
ncbi:MAG: hypothetical protein ACRC2T_10135 [Thermoguttaceae bacterium]